MISPPVFIPRPGGGDSGKACSKTNRVLEQVHLRKTCRLAG
jgi:hypothetical protein